MTQQRPNKTFFGAVASFACLVFGMVLLPTHSAHAVGTLAGETIENSASASFSINGVDQPDVDSNTVSTLVDEILNVVVASADAGNVPVSVGMQDAVLSYTVTNTGNGEEVFRLIADLAVGGDDFNLVPPEEIFIESNGTPGLQDGASGDTVYVLGDNDPTIAADGVLTVYVRSDVPNNVTQAQTGSVDLRAVANTIFLGTSPNVDDPANAGFPASGVFFADQGAGGGAAVVGATYDQTGTFSAELQIVGTGTFIVDNAEVEVTKSTTTVLDPFGGATVVPGSVLTYEIRVEVTGNGSVQGLVVTDPLPAEVTYLANSITLDLDENDGTPPTGLDDDLSDNSGFDSDANEVVVAVGDIDSGAPIAVITFQATVQ